MSLFLRPFLKRCVRHGSLRIETSNGSRFSVGDGTGTPINLRFVDRASERELVFNPAMALGELFTQGRLIVSGGSIYDLLELLGQNIKGMVAPALGTMWQCARTALRTARRRNTAQRSRRHVSHHYDQDGRLYDLFLDSDRQYSCAYFEHPGQSLDMAQLAKKRHIAAKLLIEPDARVLDIGSGWGGLAIYLAQYSGALVTGVTLSKEQLDVATKRAAESKLCSAIDFRLEDYRGITDTFDRIVSVGMFEHVGLADYGTYFRTANGLLADDGVMLLHSIGRLDGASPINPWIEKYIFPGSYAPALSEVLPEIEKSGLIVTDIEILRLHYATTLALWRRSFVSRKDEAVRLFGEEFSRMWEFYLASCEAGFRYGGLMVFQIQLAKQLDAVPLTRNYISTREAQLAQVEAANSEQREAAE
jgi:cyclopropane-fatty-acyl-phospholipid synthase